MPNEARHHNNSALGARCVAETAREKSVLAGGIEEALGTAFSRLEWERCVERGQRVSVLFGGTISFLWNVEVIRKLTVFTPDERQQQAS